MQRKLSAMRLPVDSRRPLTSRLPHTTSAEVASPPLRRALLPLAMLYDSREDAQREAEWQKLRHGEMARSLAVILLQLQEPEIVAMVSAVDPTETAACAALNSRLEDLRDERTKAASDSS